LEKTPKSFHSNATIAVEVINFFVEVSMLKKVLLAVFAFGILLQAAAISGWNYWVSRDFELIEETKLVDAPFAHGVIAGQDGQLYLAEYNEFSIYQNGQLQRTFTEEEVGLGPSFVDIDAQGRVWAASYKLEEGISVFDGQDWLHIPSMDAATATVIDMKIDSIGRVWLGTDNGLYLYADREWRQFTSSNSELPNNIVGSIAPDKTGQVWVATTNEGSEQEFVLTNGTVWNTFDGRAIAPIGGSIQADSQGRLWLGAWDGLKIFDGTQWTHYTPENSGLKRPEVSDMVLDAQGRAWMINGKNPDKHYAVFDGENWKYLYGQTHDGNELRLGMDGNVYFVTGSSIYLVPNDSQLMSPFAYGIKGAIDRSVFVYLSLFLIGVWLMIAFKNWGVVPGLLVGGILVLALFNFTFVLPYYFHPGIYTTVGGMVGSFVGQFFQRGRSDREYADWVGGTIGCGGLMILTGCPLILLFLVMGR
jgi:ligand-binding sensor domain-containing protein